MSVQGESCAKARSCVPLHVVMWVTVTKPALPTWEKGGLEVILQPQSTGHQHCSMKRKRERQKQKEIKGQNLPRSTLKREHPEPLLQFYRGVFLLSENLPKHRLKEYSGCSIAPLLIAPLQLALKVAEVKIKDVGRQESYWRYTEVCSKPFFL